MKLKVFLGSFLALLLLIMVNSASALPIDTTPGQLFNNILHDTSAEYVTTGDAIIGFDDVLAGDVVFHKINDDNIGAGSGYEDLTAHFEIKVTGKTQNATKGGWDYTFGSTVASGAMAWFYTDADNDATFSDPTSFVDGDLWAVFGLTDSDTSWTAWTLTDNIVELASLVATHPTTASDYGTFTFYLDVLENYTSLTFLDVGVDNTQLQGQGHFQATTNDYHASYAIGDQTDMAINVVPEPATMFLLGTGLLGAAFISRRRKED